MRRTATTATMQTPPLWAAFGNAGNDQLVAATDCATAMFKGFEAMRKVQERTAHDAASRHASAAERLKNGCSATDIAAIQADLLRSNLEGARQYWQQLAATGMEMQTRMLAAWNRTIDTEAVLESLSTLAGRPH